MVEMRNSCNILAGQPEKMRPLGRHRWEDNIKIYLKKYTMSMLTGFIWLGIETSCGLP
jgi:hypothetical protein